jgi:hypothetical protein
MSYVCHMYIICESYVSYMYHKYIICVSYVYHTCIICVLHCMSTCIWMATLYVFLMSVSHNYHQCIYRPMMLAISQTASHQQTWSQPTQSKSPLRSNVQRALLHRGNIETPVSGIKCKVNKCKYLQAGPAHRRGGSVCGFFNAKSINASISKQGQRIGEIEILGVEYPWLGPLGSCPESLVVHVQAKPDPSGWEYFAVRQQRLRFLIPCLGCHCRLHTFNY